MNIYFLCSNKLKKKKFPFQFRNCSCNYHILKMIYTVYKLLIRINKNYHKTLFIWYIRRKKNIRIYVLSEKNEKKKKSTSCIYVFLYTENNVSYSVTLFTNVKRSRYWSQKMLLYSCIYFFLYKFKRHKAVKPLIMFTLTYRHEWQ